MKDKIKEALELLRMARNNMSRDEYRAAVDELCEDGNNRYPLLEAGNVAEESHARALVYATGRQAYEDFAHDGPATDIAKNPPRGV